MRLLLTLAAALALAGCQVELEGAACAVPGAGDQCPSGQRCGNDLRCSARAAACADRCAPGERGCVGGDVRTCVDADPVCGAWKTDNACAAAGLVCRQPEGAAPECRCAEAAGPDLYVDPMAGGSDVMLTATGVAQPPQCRFQSITGALTQAARLGAPAAVHLVGTPAILGADETFPLVVPPHVTLRSDGGEWVIESTDAATSSVIQLSEGSHLEKVTVRNASVRNAGASPARAVDATCAAGDALGLTDVVLIAGGLDVGLSITGSCTATLVRLDVSGASGPALRLDPLGVSTGPSVTIDGGRFRNSGQGIEVLGGALTTGADVDLDGIAPVEVTENDGAGIAIVGANAQATLDMLRLDRNGGTGLVLEALATSSKVTVSRSVIASNGAISARTYGPAPARTCGGVLLSQAEQIAAFSFTGNTVFGNAGDEIGVWSPTTAAWSFAGGGACGASSNVFGCSGSSAYALYSTGAAIDASHNAWWSDPPTSIVNVPRVGYGTTCTPGAEGVPLLPTCTP